MVEIPDEAYGATEQALYAAWYRPDLTSVVLPDDLVRAAAAAVVRAIWPLAYRAGREAAVRDIETKITELERYGPSLLLMAYRLAAGLARGNQPRTPEAGEDQTTEAPQ